MQGIVLDFSINLPLILTILVGVFTIGANIGTLKGEVQMIGKTLEKIEAKAEKLESKVDLHAEDLSTLKAVNRRAVNNISRR